MRVALFYNDAPGTVGLYFLKAFRALGHTVDHFPTHGAEGWKGDRYDLYLRIDHGDYAHDLPRRLHPKAFYVVDTHLQKSWKSIRRQAVRYDVIYCVQRQVVRHLPRAFWVPLACDPDFHTIAPLPMRYDVAFVGNDGGVPRKFYLEELRVRYPNSFIGKAAYTDMAAIYGQARIGFHYIACTSPFGDMISMRVFEVLAAGRLLIANALGKGDFEAAGLRDRQEVVLYHSPAELFELTDYYLHHEEERERIASAGHACVIQRHTYRHRAERMVSLLQKELGLNSD